MNQPDQHAREHLSAGIDGELSHEELRFLLRRLDHDGELRRTWVSYHVARDGLRKQLPPLAEAGFVSRANSLKNTGTTIRVASRSSRNRSWPPCRATIAGCAGRPVAQSPRASPPRR